MIQFIKRYLYLIYSDNYGFTLSYKLKQISLKHKEKLLDIYINKTWEEEKTYIQEIMTTVMKDISVLSLKNLKRKRDIYEYNRRNEEYPDAVRYLAHPFLFVVESGVIKTTELYSGMYDFRHINSRTTTNNIFNKWLIKKELVSKIQLHKHYTEELK